jgi:hypothetical protein
MNLSLYVSVAEAAAMAGVSPERIRQLVAAGKLAGEKKAGVWLVLRADAAKFVRIPNMGRPKRAKKKTRRKRG